jgi:hypothetical protein
MSGMHEEVAVALCRSAHASLQAVLLPVHDTGDPRDAVAACYACQRHADALHRALDAQGPPWIRGDHTTDRPGYNFDAPRAEDRS